MIYDEETGLTEADVTINGVRLSFAESMTLRVAVSSFRMSMAGRETRRVLGRLAHNYDHHCAQLEAYLLKKEEP